MDFEQQISYSDNLIQVLKEEKDVSVLKQFLNQSSSLHSQTDQDLEQVQKSIQEYEKKLDACKKQAAAAAESESVTDAELCSLQEELEHEQLTEQTLREELRAIVNEISELEQQGDSFEERSRNVKKLQEEESKEQMMLSMYASVTNIIPYMVDQSKISGHIVPKDKKAIEKFEFDPSKATAFDTCNDIWKMIKF